MENKPWAFFALSFLSIAYLLLGRQTGFAWLLFVLWLIRIICLKNQKIIIQILVSLTIAFLAVASHKVTNETQLTGTEKSFVLALQPNSLKIDGDYLSVMTSIKAGSQIKTQEKLMLQYYIPSKEEQEKWLNSTPPTQILVEGELIEPTSNTNFHQFNYQAYLKRQKVHWQFKAKELKILGAKPSFWDILASFRFQILRYMDQNFDKKLAGYLKVLFIGEKNALADPVKESYRALGLIHLFSISGFHISYLTGMFQSLLLRLGVSRERTQLILVMVLPIYALIAGLSIGIFRAVLQKIIQIFSILLNRKISPLDAWSLTLIVALLLNPYFIFELAFQLSYSLSGLFIIMSQVQWNEKLNCFQESLLFSALALLVSTPILTYHFYEISWFTLVANLIFIPLFTYLFIPLLTFLLFMSLIWSESFVFLAFNQSFALILSRFEKMILAITQRHNFSAVIGRLPLVVLFIVIGLVLYILKEIEQKQWPSLFIFLLLFICLMCNRLSPIGYVLILDVGQGDSILIKEPWTQKVTLIDTGGRLQWQEKEPWRQRDKDFTIGKNKVVPSIKSLGVSQIDRLYISHPHADHMGELKNIYEELAVKEIAAGKDTLKDPGFKKQLIGINSAKILDIQKEVTLNYPTSETIVLHPKIDYPDKNNQSLVLYVKIGEDKWLFTGDLETRGEQDLIRYFPSLKVDYLKAGHHGSATSSTEEFIDQIQPQTAFISVGANNNYGHPSPEVLERFQRKQISFYTTAHDGAIKVNYFKVPFFNKWLKKVETAN